MELYLLGLSDWIGRFISVAAIIAASDGLGAHRQL
jgi:hypothetical protein